MKDQRKISFENPPPPYNQSSSLPLVLAGTTTTRTEVVTTTTTETTTHFFSLPSFRKRAGPGHQSPKDDYPNHNIPALRLPSDIALFEKALPPIPTNETGSSQNDPMIMEDLTTSSPIPQLAPDVVHSTTSAPQTYSMTPLTHAASGKGLPFTSSSSYPETNTIPFVSCASPIPSLPSPVRKSRSFQWLKRNVSEIYAPSSNDDHLNHSVSERHRGLSFGANPFLGIGLPGDVDKGRPTERSSVGSNAAPNTISRRASFWSKKRGSSSNGPSNHQSHKEDTILTLPPLPSIHHVSPFNISHLTEAPSSLPVQTTVTNHVREMSKSCSEINERASLSPGRPSFSGSIPSQGAPFSDPSCNVGPRETAPPLLRPRAQTNPPFLRRLSMGVSSTVEPSPPLHIHASDAAQLLPISPTIAQQAVPKPIIPKPLGKDESPDIYLTRLQLAVSKAEVAGILASRYVASTTYLHYIHSRIARIHFMSRFFGHTSINSTFFPYPLTLRCGNCSWK
jgi:hypothetical protein